MFSKYIVLPRSLSYSSVFSIKPEPVTTLWYMLHEIPDPRRAQGRRHDLPTLLTLAILAICCGQESYQAMHEWGSNYQEMLHKHVTFLSGHTPDAATFHRVFSRLDQVRFEEVVGKWLQAVIPTGTGEGIALDGKSVHGTSFHLVAAFAHVAKSVLFQMGTEEKGKELVIGPQVLKHVTIKDHMVTGDALFAQKTLCEQIVKDNGGYVFRVKANQETLEQDIRLFFKELPFGQYVQTYVSTDRWKGQKEIREVSVCDNRQLLSYLSWPGLTHVWQMKKTVVKKGCATTDVSVGIACIPKKMRKADTAEQIALLIRGHWTIENRLHRQRDVVFHEDLGIRASGAVGRRSNAHRCHPSSVLKI